MKKIMNFIKDEDGLELAEYAVMGGLVIVLMVATITALREDIVAVFGKIGDAINPTP